jgi:hypothetical protein
MPVAVVVYIVIQPQGTAGIRTVACGPTAALARTAARERELATEQGLKTQGIPGTRTYSEVVSDVEAMPVVRVELTTDPDGAEAFGALLPGGDWLQAWARRRRLDSLAGMGRPGGGAA